MSAVDPLLLAVLSNRFETIVHEMENTLLRTGRSTVLNVCRDFSCAIVSADHQLISSGDGLPVHVIGMDTLTGAVMALHDDVAEGDAFLDNDPYHGNSHPADHTILAPVFVGGRHLFTAVAKAHQADCGNSAPTSYMPFARDVYEEGALIFPGVRVQRGYENCEDIMRMCRRRIRVPDQWYGDYLATLGAARIGEARLKEVCERYGADVVESFVEEWFDYSERRIVDVIRAMPAGEFAGSGSHDPVEGAPDGVPINVKVRVDPAAAYIDVDLTDNIDCIPAGINQSETCAINNAMTGVFNSIDSDIPHNAGSFRRVRVRLRENCVVGIPRFPHSCSVATTNVADRLVSITQKAFADAWDGYGLAEGASGMGPGSAVISGTDRRKGGDPYMNQKIAGCQGGPGGPEFDGWITYQNAVTAGLMFRDSVEIDEQRYPILVTEVRIRPDSEGAGRRRGAPGARVAYGPRFDPMLAFYIIDGHRFPPRGARGGMGGTRSEALKVLPDGTELPLPPIADAEIQPGEVLMQLTSGGGGYGEPLEREPELVRDDVLSGFVSFERARAVYGVAFVDEIQAASLEVDTEVTAELRRGAGSLKLSARSRSIDSTAAESMRLARRRIPTCRGRWGSGGIATRSGSSQTVDQGMRPYPRPRRIISFISPESFSSMTGVG
jgi:N-methylhydantoinase B